MKEEIYNQIKNIFIDIEVNKKVSEYTNNRYDLSKYYEIGKLIDELSKEKEYGDKIIEKLSKRLSSDLTIHISRRTLFYIKKFYEYQKGQPVVAQLSRSHYILL